MADKQAPRALALMDFDGTLIPGDSIVSFVRFARKKGAMPRREYLSILAQTVKYLLGGMTDAAMKTRSLRFLNALAPDRQKQLAEDFVRQELLPRVYPAGKAEIERQKKAGRTTLLVSASTENYMQYVSAALGFDALLCTPLEADGSVRRNCKGEEKIRRVKEWLSRQGLEADWESSWAFGDSKSDAAMLRQCGHPVPVNPRRALRQAFPHLKPVHWQ